ncbi:MAG TPA: glycosyltransferase family 87 protein [Xanthobacteraceae bacterium]|nr:glycosyltransferase family 87 protein [Xanthobacteraceae bacterium]
MSAHEAAPAAAQGVAARRPTPERLISLLGLTLALGYLAVLVTAALGGNFLLDGEGRPIANDFVNVWAAGRLALDGNPAAAYDWTLHKAAEVRAVGHAFANYYGWHYPPPFLFVATALATLPYLVAALVWLAATLTAYAATLGGILRSRAGILLALGFPAALWNVTACQNGFFTAALIGGTLGLLERHPALAGLCLGFLTYKPQFGLLFPIVLIADRRWLTIAVAALAAGGLAAASWLAFGGACWEAFLHWMPITGRVVLGEGAADWSRLQSLFGLMRAHGAGEALAWTVQSAGSFAVAAALILLWRSRACYEIKAAGLAVGALLATPYIYMYDLVVLAVAIAFLLRLPLQRGFSAADSGALAAAGILILAFPYVKTQVGLAAVLIVAALIVKHTLADKNRSSAKIAARPTR